LEEYVHKGAAKGDEVVQQVMTQIPQDALVPGRGLLFRASKTTGQLGVEVPTAGCGWSLHDNALTQACSKASLPVAYARHLQQRQGWGAALLADNLTRLFQQDSPEDRFLVRSVAGQARGFLSSKYRRMDSRPILDALMGELSAQRAIVSDGFAGEVRVQITAILPRIVEPVPGEPVVFGLSFANSDFGRVALEISGFAMRLIGLNGAIGASELRKAHLGLGLGEDFRSETYALDTLALASATRDTVKHVLSPAAVQRRSERIQAANAVAADPDSFRRRELRGLLTVAEIKTATGKFNSLDVVDLPPGNTAWRLSNAISWLANQAEGERKIELQRAADKVIELAAA
jgi:hypothetical protein